MTRSTKHKAREIIVALVYLAAGPGTARTLKGKARDLSGATQSGLAQAAAGTAVRLEAEGKADMIAGRLEAEAASALKRTRAEQKSIGRGDAGTAQPDAKK